MQWPRRCAPRRWGARGAVLVVAALAVPWMSAASAQTFLGFSDVSCSGVTVGGEGLPRSAGVTVTLTDPERRALERQALTTSASGSFTWRVRTSLSGLRSVRAIVTRAGASTPIMWAEHSVPSPCPLVNTGSNHAMPLAGLALSLIVLGFLLLTAVSYRIRLGLYQGRHAAAR